MADLTRDDVLKLARLARLDLTDDEVAEYQKELSNVLQFVQQIQDADVTGLQPTSQVTGLTNVMREDEILDYGVSRDDLLALAPNTESAHIKVNRIIG